MQPECQGTLTLWDLPKRKITQVGLWRASTVVQWTGVSKLSVGVITSMNVCLSILAL